MLNKLTVGASVLLGMPLATAQTVDDPGLRCVQIQDNQRRLACFDQVYAMKSAQAAQSKSVDLARSVEATRQNNEATIVFADKAKANADSSALNEPSDAYTPLSVMYDLDQNDPRGVLSAREHNPIYLMPVWYNHSPNRYPHSPTRGVAVDDASRNQKNIEAKIQVSFKTKLLEDLFKTRADLWFGYTQNSSWQVWNGGNNSAPFRNNDYQPEIFLTQPVKAKLPWDGKLRMVGIGLVHQSNGQSQPLSRSWNRAYAMAGMEWGKLTVIPRVWAHVFEDSGDQNDNPNISHYMGYSDLKVQYLFNDKQRIHTTMRINPRTDKGAIRAGYTFPLKGQLKGYIQGFHGYGETLLDYNHEQTGVGIGLMLNDWDGF